MIDGAHEGAFATHPTIAERVAAIVAVTGSMALIAPARRDTRPPATARGRWLRPPAGASRSKRHFGLAHGRALAPRSQRVSSGDEFNRLGLTREMTFGASPPSASSCGCTAPISAEPAALAAGSRSGAAADILRHGRGRVCAARCKDIGWLVGLAEEPTDCGEQSMTRCSPPIAARAACSG